MEGVSFRFRVTSESDQVFASPCIDNSAKHHLCTRSASLIKCRVIVHDPGAYCTQEEQRQNVRRRFVEFFISCRGFLSPPCSPWSIPFLLCCSSDPALTPLSTCVLPTSHHTTPHHAKNPSLLPVAGAHQTRTPRSGGAPSTRASITPRTRRWRARWKKAYRRSSRRVRFYQGLTCVPQIDDVFSLVRRSQQCRGSITRNSVVRH